MFAKRLLHSQSVSMDAEEVMINKLKQECGTNFTLKLERRLKDMKLSKELMLVFKTYLNNAKPSGSIEMNVNILTEDWPTYQPMEVHMPSEMVQYREVFEQFYLEKHSKKKLQWQPNLEHCVLNACFTGVCLMSHIYCILE